VEWINELKHQERFNTKKCHPDFYSVQGGITEL